MEKEKNKDQTKPLYSQKSQIEQKAKPETSMNHGYVSMSQDNKEVIAPPGQLAIEGMNKPDNNFDVGKKTYMFQGDAQEIVDFLDKNKEMTFTAHTLGKDGNWGVGKDPENANLTMSLSAPQPGGPSTHGELLVDNAKRFVNAAITPGVGETIEFATSVANIADRTNDSIPAKDIQNLDLVNSNNPSLEQLIENKNEQGLKKTEATSRVTGAISGQTRGSVIVNPDNLSGKIQRAKNKAHKSLQNLGVEKVPIIGKKIQKKIAEKTGKKINARLNPYYNPNQHGVAHINLGKPKVTFGEIAQQIREKVLAEKQVKTNQEEISGDTTKRSQNEPEPTKEIKNTEKIDSPKKDKIQKSNSSPSLISLERSSSKAEIKSYPLEKMGSAQNKSPKTKKNKAIKQHSKKLEKSESLPSKLRL